MAAMSYVPALDGVRALAVTAVLCFHGGVPGAGGGFLGVDAFFVLSGYLITTLLLTEWQRTHRIDVAAFWGRRARRLLPALVVMVAVVVLAAPALTPGSEPGQLRHDAWATLAYLNNWQMISGGSDYFAVTAAPSPLEHTWSLAIEEQFYLLWPLLLVLVLRWRHPRRRLLLLCLGGVAASTVALAALHDAMNPGRAYYGTDTRGASLLIGAALAVLLSEPAVVAAFGRSAWPRRTLGGLTLVASIAVMGAWTRFTGDDSALYHGAMTAFGVAVALVLAHVALVPEGAAGRLLSLSPLTALGRISYGVYLWHWPIFLAVSSERSGLHGWPLFLTRCCLTLGVAATSYVVLERPIRSGAWLRRRSRAVPGALIGVTGCALLVAVATSVPGPLDPAGAADLATSLGRGGLSDLSAVARDSTGVSDATGDEGPATGQRQTVGHGGTALPARHHRRPGRPVVVDVFGDSMATTLVAGLPSHPGLDVRDRTLVGCGVTLKAPYRYFGHTYPTVWRSCRPWVRLWQAAIAQDDPDVALILVGRWETMDRMLDGRWTHVGEPDFDAHLRSRLQTAIRIAGSRGARVMLATEPYNRRGEQADGSLFPEDVPTRVTAWNHLLRSVTAADRGVVLADFGHRVTPGSGFSWTAGGLMMRTDGVHLAPEGVRRRIAPWLFRLLERWAPR
jgi:peptidoglycan/LPS O-acetylase OafA/YrhL